MTDTVWIIYPRLWVQAQKMVERNLPRASKAFWRKVLELYRKVGGQLHEDLPDEDAALDLEDSESV